MNFDLSQDQQLIVETVASFVKKQSPISRSRSLREDAIGWSPKVWRQMAEFGWIGAALPEAVGGAGGRFVDAALILEQLGVTLVPEPLLDNLVAATAILRAGDGAQAARWVAPMVAGETSLALAWAEVDSRYSTNDIKTTAVRAGSGWRLSGNKRFVLNGHAADSIIVSAIAEGALALFVVDRAQANIQSIKTMDGHHAAMIALDDVEVANERRLGDGARAAAALDAALDVGAAGACAEGAGILRTVLWMTADYLRTREQFGVKIGTFQALQHRAVDMFVEAELCKSMAIGAAIRIDDPDDDERRAAVSAAKAQLSVGGRFVTQQAIQLHGGIGVTDEHDVGLYFKRMHILNCIYGDEEHHLQRFAALPSFTTGI
jgi:alkylation response protein AidB-like acyl-CoA dehydrogenase